MLRLRELSEEERKTVERLVHARNTPVGKLKRTQIIWLASQGQSTPEIARQLPGRISEPPPEATGSPFFKPSGARM